MQYAIVDIETSGSVIAAGNGITEIGIVIHDGKEIVQVYETLVNPQQYIPRFIQSLTGITNDMVADAPTFAQVAGEVHELLKDKVFIAHNVSFDYPFVKHHLQFSGYDWDAPKLCTIKLSRKIVPGLERYGLGKLCTQLGIPHSNHHRAGGDALATANLFSYLMERNAAHIKREVQKITKPKPAKANKLL